MQLWLEPFKLEIRHHFRSSISHRPFSAFLHMNDQRCKMDIYIFRFAMNRDGLVNHKRRDRKKILS